MTTLRFPRPEPAPTDREQIQRARSVPTGLERLALIRPLESDEVLFEGRPLGLLLRRVDDERARRRALLIRGAWLLGEAALIALVLWMVAR